MTRHCVPRCESTVYRCMASSITAKAPSGVVDRALGDGGDHRRVLAEAAGPTPWREREDGSQIQRDREGDGRGTGKGD